MHRLLHLLMQVRNYTDILTNEEHLTTVLKAEVRLAFLFAVKTKAVGRTEAAALKRVLRLSSWIESSCAGI